MFNFIKKKVIAHRLQDEILYECVLDELEAGVKTKGLWAKAYADSEGDSDKIEPLYMKYRVQAIKDIFTSLQIAYDELPKKQIIDYLENGKVEQKPIVTTKPIEFEDNVLVWADKESGLMWEVKNRSNIEDKFTFDESIEYAQKLSKESYAGFSDWKVPTKEELQTIVAEKKYNGKYIKEALSKNSSSFYWSSTVYESDILSVWYLDLL